MEWAELPRYCVEELALVAGRTLDVPSTFIGGRREWGTYQPPGAPERLETRMMSTYQRTHLVDGAGHWDQQEQPDAVITQRLAFLRREG